MLTFVVIAVIGDDILWDSSYEKFHVFLVLNSHAISEVCYLPPKIKIPLIYVSTRSIVKCVFYEYFLFVLVYLLVLLFSLKDWDMSLKKYRCHPLVGMVLTAQAIVPWSLFIHHSSGGKDGGWGTVVGPNQQHCRLTQPKSFSNFGNNACINTVELLI